MGYIPYPLNPDHWPFSSQFPVLSFQFSGVSFSSQFTVFSSQFPVPSSLLPNPCSLIPVPWSLIPVLWSLIPDPWSLIHDPWSLIPDPWYLEDIYSWFSPKLLEESLKVRQLTPPKRCSSASFGIFLGVFGSKSQLKSFHFSRLILN